MPKYTVAYELRGEIDSTALIILSETCDRNTAYKTIFNLGIIKDERAVTLFENGVRIFTYVGNDGVSLAICKWYYYPNIYSVHPLTVTDSGIERFNSFDKFLTEVKNIFNRLRLDD